MFDEAIDEVTRKQQHRVPLAVVDYLEERLAPILEHRTKRNRPLTTRQQLEIFLHYIGTNGFYHLMRDARGPATNTIYRVVHRVADAILTLKDEVVDWPEDCSKIQKQFFELGGFPKVAGCMDGCHVLIQPPKEDESSYVNRHHQKSINVLAVCGPDCYFYYVNANNPGCCHDANVVRKSSLWTQFEGNGERPFQGAVILADSAYPLTQWCITPFPHDPDGAKGAFNKAHIRTRNCVERAFGQVKKRFYALHTGIRLKDPLETQKVIVSAFILHNLSIKLGSKDDELSEDEEEDDNQPQAQEPDPEPEVQEGGTAAQRERERRERRRNQLLNFFQQ